MQLIQDCISRNNSRGRERGNGMDDGKNNSTGQKRSNGKDERSIDSHKLLPAQTTVSTMQPITNCPFKKKMQNGKMGEKSQHRRSLLILNGKLPTFLQGVKVSKQDVNDVENDYHKRKLDDMYQQNKIENICNANDMTSSLPSHAERNALDIHIRFQSRESDTTESCTDSVGSSGTGGSVNAKQNCSTQIFVLSKNDDGSEPQKESGIDVASELGNHEPSIIPPNDRIRAITVIFSNYQSVSIWIHDDNALTHSRNPEVLQLS